MCCDFSKICAEILCSTDCNSLDEIFYLIECVNDTKKYLSDLNISPSTSKILPLEWEFILMRSGFYPDVEKF